MPNPGTYEYKSFIGEGPKYTMKQKYDNDLGQVKSKRHQNAPRIPDTPGPGSYEIIDKETGPKYTMRKKYKILNKKGVIPPVGKYNLRADDMTSVGNGYLQRKEERTNLSINKQALAYPGPGAYNPGDSLSSTGPKFSFSKSERGKVSKRAYTPGPGTYAHKEYTGREGVEPTFAKEVYKRYEVNKNPAPGQYFENNSYLPDSACYSFPRNGLDEGFKQAGPTGNTSFDIRKTRRELHTPGPEKYDPNAFVSSTRRQYPSWKLGTSSRFEVSKSSNEIGPGSYSVSNGQLPEGLKYSMGAKLKAKEKFNFPGPGKYEIVVANRPSEPKYSIGKEQREDDLKRIKKDKFPGPGSYTYKDSELTKTISFPKDARYRKQKEDKLGPGSYKIPCRFNDISMFTREHGNWNPIFKVV